MCTFLLNSLSEKFLIIGWYSIYIFGFIDWMFQSHLWYIICLAIMGCPHKKAGFLQEVPITLHLKASLSGFSDCVSYYSFITQQLLLEIQHKRKASQYTWSFEIFIAYFSVAKFHKHSWNDLFVCPHRQFDIFFLLRLSFRL